MKAFVTKPILATLIICLLILAGIFVSKLTSKDNSPQTTAFIQASHSYVMAVSSVGPLLDRRRIEISNIDAESRTATIEILAKDLGEIKEGQRVLFFKKDLKVQHDSGSIQRIVIEKSDALISISIPSKIDLATLSLTADIFTLEQRKVKRIPLAALLKEEDGRFYVWVAAKKRSQKGESEDKSRTVLDTMKPVISGAERMKNKKTLNLHQDLIGKSIKRAVEKLYVTPGAHNNLLVDIGYSVNRQQMVVMNPDSKLLEENTYSFLFKTIKAPSLLPHYEAALIEGRRIERQVLAKLRQKATNCQNKQKDLIEENNLSPDYYSNKKEILGKQSFNSSEPPPSDDVGSEWDILSLLGISETGAPTGSCGF